MGGNIKGNNCPENQQILYLKTNDVPFGQIFLYLLVVKNKTNFQLIHLNVLFGFESDDTDSHLQLP